MSVPYPKGVWCSYGNDINIQPGMASNFGLVGIGITEDWNVVNTGPGVYNWATIDARIAQALAAGFTNMALAITDSSQNTPDWLYNSLPSNEKIQLIDPANVHPTFCEPINTALFWGPTFHQAKKDLIAAMGARYTNHPNVVAVNMAAFCNHNSQDWNVLDYIGSIQCPTCPQAPPKLCGLQTGFDQPAQWIAAGWTEQVMLQIGKEICDACAVAFPNQNLKLPIGGISDHRMATNYSLLARDIENYIYGNVTLGIPPRPYAGRFFMQRNTLDASWQPGSHWDTNIPGFDAENYIKYMIRKHHPQSGLQNVADATNHASRLGQGYTGCPGFDPVCVVQTAIDVAISFGVTFYEVFPQDGGNPAFYNMIKAGTIAMGGIPRNSLPPLPPPHTPVLAFSGV